MPVNLVRNCDKLAAKLVGKPSWQRLVCRGWRKALCLIANDARVGTYCAALGDFWFGKLEIVLMEMALKEIRSGCVFGLQPNAIPHLVSDYFAKQT